MYEVRPELHDLKPLAKEPIAALYLAFLHLQTSGLLSDPFTGTTGTARGLDLLRSGRCCGNLVPAMDVNGKLKKSLQLQVQLLHEIAKTSPRRKKYHSME